MSRSGRLLVTLACVVVSGAALLNVFAANDDVLASAKRVACGQRPCTLTHMERTPFAQTFELQSGTTVTAVRCARTAVFFGKYVCAKP